MFKLEAFNPEAEAKTLRLSDQLFHEALKEVPQSMERFHVKNDKGEDFDIVYWDNEDDIEPIAAYPKYVKPPFIARYPFYDETDTQTLYLEFLHQFERVMFEELNEYTIVLTRVILADTALDIWCRDERISWFAGESDRIHIVDSFPENRFADTTLYIQEQHRCGLEDGNFKRLSAVYAFHNVFFLQWILDRRDLKNYKFLTLPINDAGGIGALLSAYTRNQALAQRLGLKFVAPDKEHFGKYPRPLVEKYFAVDIWDPETTEANTLVVPGVVVIVERRFEGGEKSDLISEELPLRLRSQICDNRLLAA